MKRKVSIPIHLYVNREYLFKKILARIKRKRRENRRKRERILLYSKALKYD